MGAPEVLGRILKIDYHSDVAGSLRKKALHSGSVIVIVRVRPYVIVIQNIVEARKNK